MSTFVFVLATIAYFNCVLTSNVCLLLGAILHHGRLCCSFIPLYSCIILGKCSALWGKRERVVWSIGVMLLHDPS